MKVISLLLPLCCAFLLISSNIYSQTWQETTSAPEGSGVTDILVRQSNQNIFVTTGSFSWPSGSAGGIRRSSDDGATWENLMDVYVGRTIIEGADGNLYASAWPYPSNEGIYRSTDNGNSWGIPMYTVPAGNNIFSIAVNITTTPHTIFAGTRNGPLRSTDNGTTWAYASTGFPANSWVRDIEVDSGGYVVAATTNGVFTSTDNGDQWSQATGIAAGDTLVKILFDYPTASDRPGAPKRAIIGSNTGNLYQSFRDSKYLAFTLLKALGNNETSGLFKTVIPAIYTSLLVATFFPKSGSGLGVHTSSDEGNTWEPHNDGLPANPNISGLAGHYPSRVNPNSQDVYLYVGLFDNTLAGAKVYKATFTFTGIDQQSTDIPSEYSLKQNYPNPFNPTTKISYSIPANGFVSLKVYDMLGNEVASLVNGEKPAGNYQAEFNAANLASGIYFYRLHAGNFVQVRKMILLK